MFAAASPEPSTGNPTQLRAIMPAARRRTQRQRSVRVRHMGGVPPEVFSEVEGLDLDTELHGGVHRIEDHAPHLSCTVCVIGGRIAWGVCVAHA